MLAADDSEPIETVKGSCAGQASRRAKEGTYFLRDDGNGVVKLTDDESDGFTLKKDVLYTNQDPRIEYKRSVDWGLLWRWTKFRSFVKGSLDIAKLWLSKARKS